MNNFQLSILALVALAIVGTMGSCVREQNTREYRMAEKGFCMTKDPATQVWTYQPCKCLPDHTVGQ